MGQSKILVKILAGIRLKKPLPLYIEHNDVLRLRNDELGLVACGKTLVEALDNMDVVFERVVVGCLKESDEVPSEKTQELRQKLQEVPGVCGSAAALRCQQCH